MKFFSATEKFISATEKFISATEFSGTPVAEKAVREAVRTAAVPRNPKLAPV